MDCRAGRVFVWIVVTGGESKGRASGGKNKADGGDNGLSVKDMGR